MAGNSMAGPLGSGDDYAVYIYDRTGTRRIDEIKGVSAIRWGRLRDDISQASVTTNGSGCAALLQMVSPWIHSLVIFRDGERVWEGPVTRVATQGDQMVIAAHDVMVWPYKRILREGYDDSYPNTRSVVERAAMILEQCLLRDDPNVAQYITAITGPDDARQSRVVAPFERMAFEEVDSLAADAGLDYTVLGRAIILWDVHNPIARLPRLTQKHFQDSPVITDYGMSAATFTAVVSGSGLYGTAGAVDPDLGLIEMLSNAYSEAQGENDPQAPVVLAQEAYDAAVDSRDLAQNQLNADPGNTAQQAALITAQNAVNLAYSKLAEAQATAARETAALTEAMRGQAARNLSGRNPVPVVVRVPDNSTLAPTANIGINQLVPGAWAPLYVESAYRTVEQWQKLDSLSVTRDAGGEKVQVTFSPAPKNGEFTNTELGDD